MKRKEFSSVFFECENPSELSSDDQNLLTQARAMIPSAYAPYSHFTVGAAILLEDGTVVQGSNQENIAFPSGLCAERVAIFTAAAQHPKTSPRAMAIVCASKSGWVGQLPVPCGACAQVMAEYENRFGRQIHFIVGGESGKCLVFDGVRQLYPLQFEENKPPK